MSRRSKYTCQLTFAYDKKFKGSKQKLFEDVSEHDNSEICGCSFGSSWSVIKNWLHS